MRERRQPRGGRERDGRSRLLQRPLPTTSDRCSGCCKARRATPAAGRACSHSSSAANLTTGADRAALATQAAEDWQAFLEARARELVDGGQLALVAGASQPDGASGAEALFTLIGHVLQAMVSDGGLRQDELDRIFYPTWNRTPNEWLAPFNGAIGDDLEVLEWRLDASDDADTYPAYRRDHDAATFARTYVGFVRAITEHPFFRSLDADRTPADHQAVVDDFSSRLEAALTEHPDVAAVWHVVSLRIRRRPRG